METFLVSLITVLIVIVAIRLWDNYRCSNTPYSSPKAPPCPTTPLSYKTYVINFPDGVVTTDKYFADIPDYTTWTEPMIELFLLIVKDWRNWERVESERLCGVDITVTHKPTGISFSGRRRVEEFYGGRGLFCRTAIEYLENAVLGSSDSSEVIDLAKIWKQVHYGDKLARIERIKTLRSARIKQEEDVKRAELNKQARLAEAQRIREYLEGVGK